MGENLFFGRAISALLFSAAGFCLLIFIVNRIFLRTAHGRIKSRLSTILVVLLVAIPFVAGAVYGLSNWIALPLTILALAAIAELHRFVFQIQHRGAPPKEEHVPAIQLHRPLTTCKLARRRYELTFPNWSGRRFRVCHLSDFHLCAHIPKSFYDQVIDTCNAANPDLVFITGDYITESRYIAELSAPLSRITASTGIFSVMGNHDFWSDPDALSKQLIAVGIKPLGNREKAITMPGGAVLTIAGCESPWNPAAWIPPQSTENPTLFLTHTPDNIYKLSKTGAFAVFAGHCHGGQGRLPLLGPVAIPSRYGRRFDHGHYLLNGTHLLLSAGIGAARPPFRIFCHPEVIFVDFVPV